MKFKRFSIWLLSPSKWLRKIRGFRLVYTPLLAIVIFTAVMGVILGTLQLQEKTQQESSLFRELSFAKQRIQLRFLNNTELLISIGRDLAALPRQYFGGTNAISSPAAPDHRRRMSTPGTIEALNAYQRLISGEICKKS